LVKEDKMEEKFKEWLRTQVKTDAPLSSYPKALKEFIPKKLASINENKYNNLFDCEDVVYLKELLERLKNGGDLHKFNVDTQSRLPSAAISKYINFLEKNSNIENIDLTIITKESNTMQKHPLNQMLYGPPGTGKTYHTINTAVEIIDGNLPQDRQEIRKRFEELKEAGQIEFVTFHQSYGYEEFVEGIKAIPAGEEGNEDGNEMIYKVSNGIFKKLSKVAESNYYESLGNKLDATKKFDYLWKKFQNIVIDEISKNEKYFLTDKVYIFEVQNERFKYKGDNWSQHEQGLNLKYENIRKMYEARVSERKEVTSLDGLEALAKQHATYNLSVLNKIYELEKSEKFEIQKETLKNYILIIDEINRGNISKIFGELITLIEPSKRIGADEEIKVKLPNSKEIFGVPQNLYIIGTMNTADRSIAQIDTALRRRFEFKQMLPRPELLDGIVIDEINIKNILEAINERIEYIYDSEHTIGHSYFMPLKDEPTKAKLDEIFRVNIIPLLAEYFYEDWEDIRTVLNNDFIVEKQPSKYIKNSSNELNKVYKIKKDFEVQEYKKIYQANE
jgi:5-methylcytosine-specific restriction protein B